MRNYKTVFNNVGIVGGTYALAFLLVAAANGPGRPRAVTGADQQFATKAAAGGMAEVKMGELAVSEGKNPSVKEFGQRMIDDHSKANDQLKSVAAQENLTLPTGMSQSEQATYDKLSKLSGAAFDRAYATMMVSDHEHDTAEFKKEANSGENDGLKSFASQTLPVLESHLTQARQMLNSVQSGD
ncbi:MAG: DUF4142 domain-containing protein [Candidatus Acidiferrum sp.]